MVQQFSHLSVFPGEPAVFRNENRTATVSKPVSVYWEFMAINLIHN